jgi:hypothetical protein
MRIILILVISLGLLTSACSRKRGGGYTWGNTYSIAWFMSTNSSERGAHFSRMGIGTLCSNWDRKYEDGKPYNMQEEINAEVMKELERRGKHPLYCKDPNYK